MGGVSRLYAKTTDLQKSNSVLRIQRKKSSQPIKTPADRILFLQRTIGNQAVQRLIKSGTLQAKLRIGRPGDKYEQEADRVADAVMRMPEPMAASGGAPIIQRVCSTCEEDELRRQPIEEEEELQKQPIEEEEELQVKSATGNISEVQPDIESHIQSLKGGGQPLSENDRTYFEPRFGRDFRQVRVHTDAKAAEAVNARAFTVGQDVVFGSGHNVSVTSEGRRLMAHELTHVVQQNGGPTLFSEGKNSSPGSVDAASRLLIQPFFTPLAPGGGFRGLMERDRRRVHGRHASTLPWIDVRSGPAASIGFGGHGFDHLFIIETDTSAREFFYRGGIRNRCAGTSWPFYGISTDSGPYLPGTVDWHPGAPSVTVATGSAAMGKGSCFNSQLARIRGSCISYEMLGPNSNTVVKTLLANCGLPLRKPAGSWTPGWGHAPI
jgi:hypothetical protein